MAEPSTIHLYVTDPKASARLYATLLDREPVEASPTFVLLTAYPGRFTLHHADLYRLEVLYADRELGLEELPGPAGVLAVEWAERLSFVPWPHVWRVALEHAGEDARRLTVTEESP